MNYAIRYADMPNRRHHTDPRMAEIRSALKTAMERNGHSQPEVSKLTGVSQSNISRLLAGERKRVTKCVKKLCHYAGLDAETDAPTLDAHRRLSQALRGAISDNPQAALALASVIESLAPILRNYRPPSVPGADHD